MKKLPFYYILYSWYEYYENNGFDFSSTVRQQKKNFMSVLCFSTLNGCFWVWALYYMAENWI